MGNLVTTETEKFRGAELAKTPGETLFPDLDLRQKRDLLRQDVRDVMYWHIHMNGNGRNEPIWRGVRVVKYPTDLLLYAETIFSLKPDWIIETGTAHGGSTLFFADMLTLINAPGKVLSIDIKPIATPPHPKAEYILGSSIDREIVAQVKSKVSGKVMVVLDSSHKARHVAREMHFYSGMVTVGQYMIVEDCYTKNSADYGPKFAVDWFFTRSKKFILEDRVEKFLIGITRGGWLKRIS
jgi:cephalosporin hydroxylase